MNKKLKSAKQMERHFKGISNHRRIEILFLIAENESITLGEIVDNIDGNLKTICEHTLKLSRAGLINKQYQGKTVIHSLTPYGKIFHNFLKTFRTF